MIQPGYHSRPDQRHSFSVGKHSLLGECQCCIPKNLLLNILLRNAMLLQNAEFLDAKTSL